MLSNESANTTHVTIADGEGNVVTSTQTINSLFGARIMIPGTGIIPNNYMYLFDPHPGHALSLTPGKRITSGITALIGKRDGKPIFALGLPGAHRIPGLGDAGGAQHRRPRHEPAGGGRGAARLHPGAGGRAREAASPKTVGEQVAAMGHPVVAGRHVGGGMCAIAFGATAA